MSEREDAAQLVAEAFVCGFWPGNDESCERAILKMRHRRELRALKEQHKIQKQGNKQCKQ